MKTLIQNEFTTRTAWLRKLLDPRKDIEAECGHPATISTQDYGHSYDRGDVARRVVNIYPEESWSESPAIVEKEDDDETAFELAWQELEDDFRVWSILQRADVLSGIGRYGVLLIGFDDGRELKEPVGGSIIDVDEADVGEAKRKLIYLRPFEEQLVTISTLDNDVKSERFGHPVIYNIQFVDTSTVTGETQKARTEAVHFSRILHIADNRSNSDVYGTPRMKAVFNRLLDLKKIAGGSGEMFWKGGFPGISIESADPKEEVSFDADATKEQMDQYMNGLQRYIALVGMTAKSLSPQVATPLPHVEVQLKLISTALGIPWRVLTGAEQGQLASGQDMIAWNRRINRRRQEYVTPFIIRPLIERLMEFGVLPTVEKYNVKWTDLNSPTDEEKATVAEKKTNALSKYVQSGMDALIPPFQYLTIVIGMEDEEAQGIIDEAGDRLDELTPDFKQEQKMELEDAKPTPQIMPPGRDPAKIVGRRNGKPAARK